jgi:hypothetical protein
VAFAEEIKRVGRRYFVQTPNKAFPLEPHVMTPLVNSAEAVAAPAVPQLHALGMARST